MACLAQWLEPQSYENYKGSLLSELDVASSILATSI